MARNVRTTPQPVPPSAWLEVVSLAQDNELTHRAIAERLGIKPGTVSAIVSASRRFGAEVPYRRPRQPAETVAEVIERARGGLPVPEIAERVGLRPKQVYNLLHAAKSRPEGADLPRGVARDRRSAAERTSEILALAREDLSLSYQEIAERTGVKPSTVGTVLSRARGRGEDLPFRVRGPKRRSAAEAAE